MKHTFNQLVISCIQMQLYVDSNYLKHIRVQHMACKILWPIKYLILFAMEISPQGIFAIGIFATSFYLGRFATIIQKCGKKSVWET